MLRKPSPHVWSTGSSPSSPGLRHKPPLRAKAVVLRIGSLSHSLPRHLAPTLRLLSWPPTDLRLRKLAQPCPPCRDRCPERATCPVDRRSVGASLRSFARWPPERPLAALRAAATTSRPANEHRRGRRVYEPPEFLKRFVEPAQTEGRDLNSRSALRRTTVLETTDAPTSVTDGKNSQPSGKGIRFGDTFGTCVAHRGNKNPA